MSHRHLRTLDHGHTLNALASAGHVATRFADARAVLGHVVHRNSDWSASCPKKTNELKTGVPRAFRMPSVPTSLRHFAP